ncbi:DUF2642 domain-containing protein [Psychrobacillus sp.]|uniref:DUF2642 domain-containing protein n=1 Tax=Psychrobacillus sp. TaxID=1871623 RepID=UPI0028BEBE46|nr:DUF2642 domain-containing protein [Psychrobacillus sp.]
MNKIIQSLIKEVVQIEISGKKLVNGTLVDLGSDMIVLFNGTDFVYIPLNHIQSFVVDRNNENDIQDPSEFSLIIADENKDDLSFKEVLTQATGKNVEIYVTDGQLLHGHITCIMNDYIVFFSPIYKTMYISMKHLKWLIPYPQNECLYDMNVPNVPVQSNNHSLAISFEEQVQKYKNTLVVLNIGGNKSYIGKIKNIEKQVVEIQRARSAPFYLNLDHIKTLHQV